MNLDILKTEWAARDARLDAALRLNARLLTAELIDRRRGSIDKHLPFGRFEQVTSVATGILLMLFIGRHVTQPEFLIPAFVMLGWVVAMIVTGSQQRTAMRNLDFAEPTVAVLKKLEAMKVRRLATIRWAFLTGQVVWWIPFFIVLFKGLLGVNLYTVNDFMPRFIAANLAIGILFIPAWIAIARLVVHRVEGTGWFQRLMDAVAGEDLVKAREFLRELERYGADRG